MARILLVEDNAGDAQLMRIALAEARPDASLSVATDGEQGLQVLRESGPFELVVLDLNLPRLSGHEVLAALREEPDAALRRQPVVVMTSSETVADVERSYALGACGHIRKPLELDDLFATVEALTRYWFDVVSLP